MTDLVRSVRALPLKAHLLLLILVFVVVGACSALYIHHQTTADAERLARKHAAYAAHVAAAEMGQNVMLVRQATQALANDPGIARVFQRPDQCALQTYGGHIDLIRLNGKAVCSSLPVRHSRDYSKEPWFRDATKHAVLDGPVRDPTNGRWAVVSAAPLKSGNGVAASIYYLEEAGPQLAGKYSGGEPFVFTVVNHRRVLLRSIHPAQHIGKPTNGPVRLGEYQALDRDGVPRYFATVRVPGTTWTFSAGIDRASALAPSRQLERRQFGILIVGLIAMFLATLGVYWLLAQPIHAMSRAIRLDKRVPTHGPRELGALAGDINAMLGRQERERQAAKMEALGRLASGIAHDFNNLLLVISSGARSLLRRNGDSLDPKGIESVERIDRAAQRGQQLTTQLLAFARQRVVTPVPTDVNVVIREMSQMLERLIGQNVVTRMELTPELPPILIDEGQLAQVILNLAINASDAMPDGGDLFISSGVTVIGPDEDAVPGRYVELLVSDTGTGMSADTMARVFEPFFTTKEEGTGLGLATVHGIVTGAGGLVDVVSEPGIGTTFRMRFPNAKLGDELITDEHDVVPA